MWHLTKIPKILHVYWGENLLSYMRYATITTFIEHNPDWKIILWTTEFHPNSDEPYFTIGHDYVTECDDYKPFLKLLPLEIRKVNIEELGLPKTASEVHKSNLIIYKALSTEGGVWADMDILFFKSLEQLKVNTGENANTETFVCISYYGHSCGFYMSSENNKYFESLLSLSKKEYNRKLYQCVGPTLCNKYYPTLQSISALTPVADIGMDALYAHDAYHIDYMMKNNPPLFTENSIGLHWYGGHKPWKAYIRETNGGLTNLQPSIISNILKQVRNKPLGIDNPKISIVMAYYNRQALLDKTIESIRKTTDTNYEIIIIDDGSDVPVVCDGATIIRVDKKDKTWTNPCVPYNMGFKAATGDIIIIQNPECYHTGDIVTHVRKNIKSNVYLSFGCYAINRNETAEFQNGVMPVIENYIFNASVRNGWYNHSVYRPKAYHFCSAILKKDLWRVGGFDERYSQGVAFDDDDFIRTIRRIGMDVNIINDPYAIHQFHTHFEFDSPSVFRPLHTRNQTLFNSKYNPRPVTNVAGRAQSGKVSTQISSHTLSRRQLNRLKKAKSAELKKKRGQ